MALHYTSVQYPPTDSFIQDLRTKVDAAIHKLRMLDDRIDAPKVSVNLKTIIAKLQALIDLGYGKLTLFEEQILTYHCGDLSEVQFDYFIKTYLPNHWNTILLKGLMHSVLLHWNKPMRDEILPILDSHISEMNEAQNVAYNNFFYDSIAPSKLGKHLRKSNVSIESAPYYVLLTETMFTYPYFEPVIRAFYDEHTEINAFLIEQISHTITMHNHVRLAKLVLPDIVLRAKGNKNLTSDIKQSLISLCGHFIGDPDEVVHWTADELSDEDNIRLQQCRKILRIWRIGKIIDTVFTSVEGGYYADRAAFWHKYAQDLITMNEGRDDFLRVYTMDERMSGIDSKEWQKYFRRYGGYKYSSKTAVIMRFGDWSIVEMLDGGCAYFYKKGDSLTGRMYDYVWSHRMYDSQELKMLDCYKFLQGDISYSLSHLPEGGRIAHQGDWKPSFKRFMYQRQIIKYDVRKDI